MKNKNWNKFQKVGVGGIKNWNKFQNCFIETPPLLFLYKKGVGGIYFLEQVPSWGMYDA
jgi:hypothetical protein